MDDEQFIDKPQNIDTNGPSQDNNFDIADTNNDQQLTEEEAKALPEVDTPQEFRLADEDDDRLISFDEYKKALSKEEQNTIDNATNKNDRYNAFNDALDKYYNEYVSTLDPNDPDYDDMVNLAKDDALDQMRNSGYRDYNPETGKDYIISPDFDSEKNIAKDTGVKSGIQETLDRAINEHNVGEMAELLNNVMPNLPSYTGTEKVEDTGEIWQEGISKDVYERLANWSFDELYELSQKVPDIKWKELANVVVRGEISDEEDQEKRSKEWLQQWEDYVSKVDSAAKQLSELSNNHIEKDEVEQILYRDYVQENKEGTDKPAEETETADTSAAPTSAAPTSKSTGDDKKPIQITEKTDVRERIIREAARHIMTHGKSLPKELKKSVQEISAKFQPFKFEHKKSKKDSNINNSEPLTYDDSDRIDMGRGQAEGAGGIPKGNVMQSGAGNIGGGYSGESGSNNINIGGNKNSSQKAGGMSLPDLPEPKFSFSGGSSFDGIGDFSKKKHPINIKMPKGNKTKKALEFPDLSPDVEQHNEMEGIPKSVKKNRPIIKRGLYQNKDDKWDNDLYSNVINDIIDKYKEWEIVDNEHVLSIPQLNMKIFYDGVSQPKIKVIGLGNKQNISTLLRREGGREALENLYNYLGEQ